MEAFLDQLLFSFGDTAINLVVAVLILIGGFLLALLVRALIQGVLKRTEIDNRILGKMMGEEAAANVNIESWIGRIAFYVIMLLVLVAFFERLELRAVTQPLNTLLNEVFSYLPQLLGAAAILLVAWILATAARFTIRRLLGAMNLDDRLIKETGTEAPGDVSITETLANAVYWLVFLLFLPALLDALDLQGLLTPVQGMVDEVLGYLPNILGAALILVIGWFIARLVRQIVTNLLAAAGVDALGNRVGMNQALDEQKLSGLLGVIVYALIMLPVIIAALDALEVDAISRPATTMLEAILAAVPNIFGAAVALIIAYFVGRLVADLVSNILTGIGFNRVMVWVGLGREPQEGERTPAEIAGYIVLVVIMIYAVSGAAELLGFDSLVEQLNVLLAFVWQVVIGIVVFGFGLYLGNLARSAILSTGGADSNMLAQGARIVIVVFAGALALRTTGIAADIVNIAFGLTVGAIAVAAALAFGLGSREIAGREVENMLDAMRRTDDGSETAELEMDSGEA